MLEGLFMTFVLFCHMVVQSVPGSGKTLAYLLPLLQRYVLPADPEDKSLKIIAREAQKAIKQKPGDEKLMN